MVFSDFKANPDARCRLLYLQAYPRFGKRGVLNDSADACGVRRGKKTSNKLFRTAEALPQLSWKNVGRRGDAGKDGREVSGRD